MKRFLTLLFTTVLLCAALCVSASASDFDAAAKELSGIGMFRGTANGFELDRAPTRSEAAIMLVRLYGAEEKAKSAYESGELTHPFTDVSAFTSPYVAWLYQQGIVNGTSATTFGSSRKCSAQNYVAFLLRALGYQDGKDFQYADALTFAKKKGFYDASMFPGDFLRDDLAALTYQALAADTADGKTYLLDTLIRSGAVDATAAKSLTDKITAYRAMTAATSSSNNKAMDLSMDATMNTTMTVDGETISLPATITGSMKMRTEDGIQAAYSLQTQADGVSVQTDTWLKDNWVYCRSVSDGEESKIKYSVEDELEALNAMSVVDISAMDVSGLAMLDSISVKQVGSSKEYTVVIGSGIDGMMSGALTALGDSDSMDLHLGKITATYTVGASGVLQKIHMTFGASLKLNLPEGNSPAVPVSAAYEYDMTMTVNATGSAVNITFPDFSDYQEVNAVSVSGVAA